MRTNVIPTVIVSSFFWSVLFLIIYALGAPATLLGELQSPFRNMVYVFLLFHLVNCFVEFFFHRYMLHAKPLAVFSKSRNPLRMLFFLNNYFCTAHRHHHQITPERHYNITEKHQEEASHFPLYALPAFFGVAFILLLPVKFLFPHMPIILCGYAAICFSYSAYEIKHALHHETFGGRWKQFVEARGFLGILGKAMHVGHRIHHSNMLLYENVFGFFGLPIADWMFGTLDIRRNLTPEGALIPIPEHEKPTPIWLIKVLDQWTEKQESLLTTS